MTPQYWPFCGEQEFFVQFSFPHTFGTLAPQTVPFGQVVPQSMVPAQPSPIMPQYTAPATEQLVTVGVHPGAMQMCLFGSHAIPDGQAPQSCELSQPSPMTPQYWPPWKVHETFVQFGFPQMPLTLAPQVVPVGQALVQFMEPPHPSPIVPQ